MKIVLQPVPVTRNAASRSDTADDLLELIKDELRAATLRRRRAPPGRRRHHPTIRDGSPTGSRSSPRTCSTCRACWRSRTCGRSYAPRARRAARSALHPGRQPRLKADDYETPQRARRHAARTSSCTTPTSRSRLGRALPRAGGRRSQRARHQADPVPHERRLAARAGLIRAADVGKQAACVVEVEARFDERANVHGRARWRSRASHVVYGVPSTSRRTRSASSSCAATATAPPLRARPTGNYHPRTGAPLHRLRAAHVGRAGSAQTSPTCSTSSPASRAPSLPPRAGSPRQPRGQDAGGDQDGPSSRTRGRPGADTRSR